MTTITLWLHNRKQQAKALQNEIYALLLAYRDPRVPRRARWFAGLVVAYALSPVDLVPDFIPILGYLDDVVLIPLGISLAVRMIPAEVMADTRRQSQAFLESDSMAGRWVAAIIIAIWVAVATLLLYGAYHLIIR